MPNFTVSQTRFDKTLGSFVVTFTLDEVAGVGGAQVSLSALENGTATADANFVPFDDLVVSFDEGEDTATVAITGLGGMGETGDTNFGLLLANPVGLTLPDGGATYTQTVVLLEGDTADDDRSIFVSDPVIATPRSDSEVVFAIEISQPFAEATSFTYGTIDGDAVAGEDYTAQSGTITFAAGETVAFVTVALEGNRFFTADARSFSLFVDAEDGFGAATLDTIGTATLLDDPTARGANIEGTDADDVLVGTNRAELMFGEEGDDIIYGLGGDDSLFGERGNDTIYGGWGSDTVIYEDLRSGPIVVNLGSNIALGEGTDRLFGIENVIGTINHDRIFGDAGANTLRGDEGNDLISGQGGDDVITGDDGDDALSGGAGNDRLIGGEGSNRLFGNDGDDMIFSSGLDIVNGGAGNDEITASAEAIVLVGGDGDDIINGALTDTDAANGGDGNDELSLGGGNDRGFGGRGDDRIFGEDGDDVLGGLAGVDRLFGGDGADGMNGGGGDDILRGAGGDDRLFGGSGNDMLRGGADNDLLVGQSGLDTFEFRGDFGDDTIVRYGEVDSGARVDEVIDVSLFDMSFADLSIVQDGTSTVITSTEFTGSITLTFVDAATITADDFAF